MVDQVDSSERITAPVKIGGLNVITNRLKFDAELTNIFRDALWNHVNHGRISGSPSCHFVQYVTKAAIRRHWDINKINLRFFG